MFNPYMLGKMFKNLSLDSVRSGGKTCPVNLGVRYCPVKKLICPVSSEPYFQLFTTHSFTNSRKYTLNLPASMTPLVEHPLLTGTLLLSMTSTLFLNVFHYVSIIVRWVMEYFTHEYKISYIYI